MHHIPTSLRSLIMDHGTIYYYSKNQSLLTEGDKVDLIFLIVNGKIAVKKDTANGRELTLRICSTNDCIAENIIFTTTKLYPISAIVLEETSVIGISKSKLELLISQHPTLLLDCIKWLQIQNIRDQSKLRDLVLYGKKGALYSTLIRLSNSYGKIQKNGDIRITHLITNSELATICATSREVINRLVQHLKKEKIILYENSQITILNLDYLRKSCDCDNCPLSVCQIN